MNKKILIIEDELPIAQIMSDALTGEEFEVQMAHDGMEGLEKIKSFEPDLILLDIMMPKMDGRQLLKELHDTMETIPFEVIVLTNVDSDIKTISDVVVHGGYDYLVKANTSMDAIVARVKEKLTK